MVAREKAGKSSQSEPGSGSVLVYVGLDRVGDGLLKLPFVRGLRKAFPDSRITWVAGKETSVYAGVLAPLVDGLIDEVIEYGGIGLHPSELLRRPLPGRRFDLIIDSQKIVWTSLSLWRVPHRRFISPAARFALSGVKPPRGYRFPKAMQRQLLDLLELATGEPYPTPLRLDLDIADDFHQAALAVLPDGPAYVGLAPGSGGRPKCWPRDRFIATAREQGARGRKPVFLLGPAEVDWQDEIQAQVPDALFPLQDAAVVNRFHFDPLFTIALAGRLKAALANDSGVGHMLAIGGAPLVCLYGTTVPEKFMPMSDRLTIIRAADFGGQVMADIPQAPVGEAVEAWLGG
ncbi:MAG: glycosyltransferase family 9 protein [Rhodospirillales bacterium]